MAAAKRIKLNHLKRTIVRPIGNDFTLRYRVSQINKNVYILDRFDRHKIVLDVSNDWTNSHIIRQQWNDDFALYTEMVLEYVIEDMDKEQYWSYDHIPF